MEDVKLSLLKSVKKERLSYLKEMKKLANQLLEENKSCAAGNAKWEGAVIENNIKQLKEMISQLNKDEHPLKVDQYAIIKSALLIKFPDPATIEHYTAITIQKIREEGFKYELSRYSVNYSLINDLYWIHDGFVGDHLNIALGTKSPEDLAVYCDDKLKVISEEVIPFFSAHAIYDVVTPMLSEIVQNFGSNSFLTTNILTPVVIESIVRKLAAWVYQMQNPHANEEIAAKFVAGFLSLESLIMKADWKEDIPMNFYTAVFESKHINDPKLDDAARTLKQWEMAKDKLAGLAKEIGNKLTDDQLSDERKKEDALALSAQALELLSPFQGVDQQPVMVSLKVKLQFLLRRFKEDRNAIIHGHFIDLDKKWKCYVNFLALVNLYRLILELESLYKVK